MKTRWSYNWVLVGFVGVGLPLAVYVTATGLKGKHPLVIAQVVLVIVGVLFALIAGSRLPARDERETSIALKATTLSYGCAWFIAAATTAVLPFFVTDPSVPLSWLMSAPTLFMLTQQGIQWASEALMLGQPE